MDKTKPFAICVSHREATDLRDQLEYAIKEGTFGSYGWLIIRTSEPVDMGPANTAPTQWTSNG